MRERHSRWNLLLAGLLLALGLLFVPECDDCYFVYWTFASWRDVLLTRPITEGANIVGVPANGRYLGNLLGVLQGKLYFTPAGFLRGLAMGGAILALALLLARRTAAKAVGRRESLALALSLLLLAPRGLWQQVYSWGAGLVNYLLPMVGLLLLLGLMEGDGAKLGRCSLIALLALGSCLFMETVTIYLALAAGGVLLWALARRRDRGKAAALCLGSWAGAAVMFTAPGYAQVGSGARTIGLESVWENFQRIVVETLVLPGVAALLISALLIWLLRRQGCPRWGLWGGLLAPIHLGCLAELAGDLFRVDSRRGTVQLLLGCALALLWLVCLAEWRGGRTKRQVCLLALSLCLLNGPLLLVTPVGSRNFFPSYVVLLLTALRLYAQARAEGLRPLTWLRGPATAAALALLLLYGCNFTVYHQRLSDAGRQAAAGAQSVTLPLVPFNGWAVNELPGKGDISYLVYRDTPWDVAFTFLPYHQWREQI